MLQIVFQATLQVPAHHAIACRIDVSDEDCTASNSSTTATEKTHGKQLCLIHHRLATDACSHSAQRLHGADLS
jgi:hypothetical protein